MDVHDLAHRAAQALESLPEAGVTPLLELLDPGVRWLTDWKGDGVFEHSELFGRTRHEGREAVRGFFDRVHRRRTPESVELTRSVIGDGEVVLLGRMTWSGENGGPLASDFTLRLALCDGAVTEARFLTLPDRHIETFIPNHRTSPELDSDRIRRLIRDFQKLYFDAYLLGKTWSETYWMGFPTFKCPLDMWVYQEMITELRPDLIVETGTCAGGSALYFAHICELVGRGRVVSIDLQPYSDPLPEHEKITFLLGPSTAEETLRRVRAEIPQGATVLVVLDSDHRRDHVYAELKAYADLVTPGSYLIVEDSNLNGHPTKPDFGPGPMEAIDDFLAEDPRFRMDPEREKFLVTWNPRGYLLKIRN
ncbi:MAG: CmcI family methyltransferase [Thermoanaerobaculia bacterium]|nr:CmcI family methyltransferase [Thermoanaerobaculia bacterium]